MAEEMGCSQQAVSNRLARLGVQTATRKQGEGRPSYNPVVTSSPEDEVVPDEDVEFKPPDAAAARIGEGDTVPPRKREA
jgi:hypothetical protein